MSAPKPVTPAEAKAVWASMPNPSSRKVSQRFTDTGRKVSYKTINVWRKANWGESPEAVEKKAEKAVETGTQAADNAAAVLTGNPEAKAETLVEDDDGLEHATGAQISDATIREVLRSIHALGKLARKTAPAHILASPDIIAKAIKDLATSTTELVDTLIRMPAVREADMRTVTGTVIEERGFTHPSLTAAQENAAREVKRLTNDTKPEPATV